MKPRRLSYTELSEADSSDYFSEVDTDYIGAFDAIDSHHKSPTKEVDLYLPNPSPSHQNRHIHTVQRNEPRGNGASSSRQIAPYPVTPTRKHSSVNAGTPASRYSAAQRYFPEDNLVSSPITPKKLFPEASASGSGNKEKQPLRLVIIDSDDSDGDIDHVSNILTDTDSPTASGGWSILNVASPRTTSLSRADSGWSIPSTSSFQSTSSKGKKRTGDSQTSTTSPSKCRKVVNPGTTTNSLKDDSELPAKSTELPPISPAQGPVENFLSGPIGIDLTPAFIAHDANIQGLLDEAELSWGVQYELARGVSTGLWTWADVEPKIDLLKGSNAQIAYKVRSIMLDRPLRGFADISVWEEMDREQAAILENCERGLGLMGEWKGDPNWHGGQIQQLARLVRYQGSYKVHLEPMEKRRSYRLARFLGSRRILQLRVPGELVKKESDALKNYLLQKFILCGRVFVPFCSKDSGVYLVETDENYQRCMVMDFGDQFRRSFSEIIQWHNPLDLNKDQPISKWSTRFVLPFSTSIPVLIFEERNMIYIDDIYAYGWKGKGKAPAEYITTDGCGFINAAALMALTSRVGYQSRPAGIQGRLAGSKGLWILHPTDTDPEPKIWIRKSQAKIVYRFPLDRAHRIFDLVATSNFSPSINLKQQSIINVWHNGVSSELLSAMMEQGLKEEVEPLMKWHGDYSMECLWNSLNQLGGVSRSRLQRVTAGLSRVLGLQGRDWGHEDIDLDEHGNAKQDLIDELATPAYTGRNEHSGAPISISEFSMELIQAGFRPDRFKPLREKIRIIVNQRIESALDEFRIPVPQSSSAFIAPDPLGILEEGEVYYRASQPMTDPETQTLFNVLTGDVLLGRYPIRLPSDIQKVVAVDRPELFKWPDLLIVSTKGRVSLASLLSGGDQDGDDAFIIRDPAIVRPFQSKPLTEMPPTLLEDNFEGQVESVTAFAQRVATMSAPDAQKSFQEILLLDLTDSKLGLYSMFNDFAAWKYGYDDPRAIRLAYMFNTLLDSSKTGLRLKAGIFEKDQAIFGGEVPKTGNTNLMNGRRPFVFHSLHKAGKAIGDGLLCRYDNIPGDSSNPTDPDLKCPYTVATNYALSAYQNYKNHTLTDEMSRIRALVNTAYDMYRDVISSKLDRSDSFSKKKKKQKKTKSIDDMLIVAKTYAQEVKDIFLIQNVDEVKASLAYHRSPPFAFSVAFRDLCLIKARASPGGVTPSTRSFDEAKSIPSTYVKALTRITMDLTAP